MAKKYTRRQFIKNVALSGAGFSLIGSQSLEAQNTSPLVVQIKSMSVYVNQTNDGIPEEGNGRQDLVLRTERPDERGRVMVGERSSRSNLNRFLMSHSGEWIIFTTEDGRLLVVPTRFEDYTYLMTQGGDWGEKSHWKIRDSLFMNERFHKKVLTLLPSAKTTIHRNSQGKVVEQSVPNKTFAMKMQNKSSSSLMNQDTNQLFYLMPNISAQERVRKSDTAINFIRRMEKQAVAWFRFRLKDDPKRDFGEWTVIGEQQRSGFFNFKFYVRKKKYTHSPTPTVAGIKLDFGSIDKFDAYYTLRVETDQKGLLRELDGKKVYLEPVRWFANLPRVRSGFNDERNGDATPNICVQRSVGTSPQ